MTDSTLPKIIRHGDVNLHRISEDEITGKKVSHTGSFTVAEGEAMNSRHELAVKTPSDLEVWDDGGTLFYKLMGEGTLTHTHDHATITIPPGIYKQIQEREVDHFAESIEREVLD